MSLQEERFISFFIALWKNHRQCFKGKTDTWTEKYEGEDGILAVVQRTLIWNDCEAEKLFSRVGRMAGLKLKLQEYKTDRVGFDEWLWDEVKEIPFGGGNKGAHRDNRHRKHFPRALREYLELTKEGQLAFYKDKSFSDLNRELHIFSFGALTRFDLLQRLYTSKHHYVTSSPQRFYLTGGGVKEGLKKIYSNTKPTKALLTGLGQKLYDKIREKMNQENVAYEENLLYFSLEDVLCIYQKDRGDMISDDLLDGKITPEIFAHKYAEKYCISKRVNC